MMLERGRTRIWAMGSNVLGQTMVPRSKADVLDKVTLCFDLQQMEGWAPGEEIVSIASENVFNLILTNRRLFFGGNNQHNVIPAVL